MKQEGDKSSVLRVAVSGGGCSGFKYNFLMDQMNKNLSLDDEDDEFDDEDEDDDYEESEDYRSHSSFSEKVIDYTEDLSGSGFQIKNTLAKSQCGCGNSFSV